MKYYGRIGSERFVIGEVKESKLSYYIGILGLVGILAIAMLGR